jgi:hypothetical protein
VDRSNRGRYKYRRKGLLDSMPHYSPARGVLVVRGEDAPRLVSFLKKGKAEVYCRRIELEEGDAKRLRLS